MPGLGGTPAWLCGRPGQVLPEVWLDPWQPDFRGKREKTGQVIVTAKTRRPTRDWVRTVLVGSDGRIVFAMLKQNLTTEFNERMVIAVPDPAGVDEACEQIAKQHLPFEQLVADMMRELVKLNVQGHVHAQELYSAIEYHPPLPAGTVAGFPDE